MIETIVQKHLVGKIIKGVLYKDTVIGRGTVIELDDGYLVFAADRKGMWKFFKNLKAVDGDVEDV